MRQISISSPDAKTIFRIFIALVLAYLLPGLVGHDPWKQDETYIFGIIQHLLETGDWVVPTLAGEPFMEKPPLFYWLAAGLAHLFHPWLSLHDGARLATGVFTGITCVATGWTANRWWGEGRGRMAVLALLACLGSVYYSHLMLTDVPLVTGFAVAGCGFVLARTKSVAAGILIGCGTGIGFLSKGVLAPGVLGVTAVLLPVLFREWRDRRYFISLAIALAVSLPWLLIWPIALYQRSYDLFMQWFWDNNVGRFFGFSVSKLGAPHSDGFWRETLPYFTFPALPLALLTLWRKRASLLREAPIQFSLILFGVMMSVLVVSASARPNYALPLLFPIALVAAPAALELNAKFDLAWDWIARILFGALAIALWWIWGSMMAHHVPPHIEWIGRILPLDFVPAFETANFIAAVLLTIGALALWIILPKFPARGLTSWVCGLALCWGLLATLWLSWVDAAKSYRSVYLEMNHFLPANHGCIASIGLNESEKGMLRYFLGILTQRKELVPNADCPLLLIDGLITEPPSELHSDQWKLLWHGARPGDTREQFWLFSKTAR